MNHGQGGEGFLAMRLRRRSVTLRSSVASLVLSQGRSSADASSWTGWMKLA